MSDEWKSTITIDGETIEMTGAKACPFLFATMAFCLKERCMFYHPREVPKQIVTGDEEEALWEWREAFCGLDNHAGLHSRHYDKQPPGWYVGDVE